MGGEGKSHESQEKKSPFKGKDVSNVNTSGDENVAVGARIQCPPPCNQ